MIDLEKRKPQEGFVTKGSKGSQIGKVPFLLYFCTRCGKVFLLPLFFNDEALENNKKNTYAHILM